MIFSRARFVRNWINSEISDSQEEGEANFCKFNVVSVSYETAFFINNFTLTRILLDYHACPWFNTEPQKLNTNASSINWIQLGVIKCRFIQTSASIKLKWLELFKQSYSTQLNSQIFTRDNHSIDHSRNWCVKPLRTTIRNL